MFDRRRSSTVFLERARPRCWSVVGFPVLVGLLGVMAILAAPFIEASDGVEAGNRRLSHLDAGGRVVFDDAAGRLSYPDSPPTVSRPQGQPEVSLPSFEPEAKNSLAATVSLEWYRAIFGTGIGHAGMVVADVDADGDSEMVASSGPGGFGPNTFWYVLDWDGQDYAHTWTSLPFEAPIDRLLVAQIDEDTALEVVLAVAGHLVAYDGATFDIEMNLLIGPTQVRDLALADLDDDGSIEAVVCSGSGTWIYDLRSGIQQFADGERGCTGVVIGETDGTPGAEIVVANGEGPGFVLDGATGAPEWTHVLGFGHLVAVGDVDGDSLDEIVAGFEWSGIQVWHGDTRGFAWELPIFNIDAITVVDTDSDGIAEVIYGDAQWGSVHLLDGLTGAEQWVVDNPEHGVTRIAFGDADNDGSAEIYFGAGFTSTGPDILHAIDPAHRELEWESLDISGPFYGLAHGDIDGDGSPELVYTTFESESGYGAGLYFVHDAVTKELEFQSSGPTNSNWTGLWKIQVADIVGDGALEIFLPTSDAHSGALQCIDGATHELWWESELVQDATFASLRVGDPDADGFMETITASDVQSTGAEGVNVYVHDAATGVLEWKSPNLQSFFGFWSRLTLLRIADIDGDDVDEILVTPPGGDLLALDLVAGTIDLSTSGIEVTALDVADLDADGTPDIVIGTEDGLLQQVDPSTGAPTPIAGPFGAPIDAVAAAPVVDDQGLDFVICSADRVHLIDGDTMKSLWLSDDLGSGVGQHDSLIVGDLDWDGRIEIWVNAGPIGHLMFEVTEIDHAPRTRRVPRPRRLSPTGR